MKPEINKWYLLQETNLEKTIIKITYNEKNTDYYEGNLYSEHRKKSENMPITPRSFKEKVIKELTKEEIFYFID